MLLVWIGGLFLFIVGSIVGSFLNVLIDRIPRGESVLGGRSHCDNCKKNLAWIDLIPVVSYGLLGGKCQYCKSRLSLYYPFVEVLTGALFVLIGFSLFGFDITRLTDFRLIVEVFYYLFLISALIVIFFTDLKYGIIPFNTVLFIFLLTIGWFMFSSAVDLSPLSFSVEFWALVNSLLSGIGAFVLFFLLFIATKGKGMGFGDVVYAFLMGFILGFPNILLGIYLSFVIGALVALLLIIIHKKKLKGGTIPFGPFLVGATFLSLFWGQFLINEVMKHIFLQ